MSWSSPKNYFAPSMSAPVELDPSAPGTIVRRAFMFEAALNLFTLPILFYPKAVLSLIVNDPSSITPITELMGQVFGGLVVGALTPALLLGLPNTRAGIESRKTVYFMLAGGEMAIIPLLTWHALYGGPNGALSAKACWLSIQTLVPPILWRCYVLFARPEMFGRYRDVNKDE